MYKIIDFKNKVEKMFNLEINLYSKLDQQKKARYIFLKSCIEYGISKEELRIFFGLKNGHLIRHFLLYYKPTFFEKDVIKAIRRDKKNA